MDDGSWLSWLIIVILLFLAAYFAISETAFASVNRIKIKISLDRGDRRAVKAMYVLDNFDQAISTILIATNIIQMVIASIATLLTTRYWGLPAVAVSTVITTITIFFIGEMLPKSIAKKYSERFALSVAASLCFFMKIFTPISWALAKITAFVTRFSRVDPEYTVTEDELYDIIENMKDDGNLDAEKGDLVHSALTFADVTVESIITARVDIAAVSVDSAPEDILAFIKQQRHSRLPVYRGSIDNIIGVLQIRKFIKAYMREGTKVDVTTLLDDVCFAHQSTNIDELLPEMSHKKLNMAVVTDNYGGTLGIVTVEDILEELVGEIWDEDDEIVESFTILTDGSFELDAGLSIEDAFELMDYTDPEDTEFNHKLLGEWAYECFDMLPQEGDSFTYCDLIVAISKMQQRRIIKLRISQTTEAAEKGGDEQ